MKSVKAGNLLVLALILVFLLVLVAFLGFFLPVTQMGPGTSSGMTFAFFPAVFALVFILIVAVTAARTIGMRPGASIQRPLSPTTSYPPPPQPDTVMVKCQYCGTSQTFSQKCTNCGAPLPKPGFALSK